MNIIERYLNKTQIKGPWICESCGELSQFAYTTRSINHVFCRNENCRFTRIIDKRHRRIVETDGSQWIYDEAGNKRRVNPV